MVPPVNKPESFAQCRIQSVYLPHGTIVGRIGRDDIDLVGIMLDAVKDGFDKRTVVTAKLIIPAPVLVMDRKSPKGMRTFFGTLFTQSTPSSVCSQVGRAVWEGS